MATCIAALYGITDEFHQVFTPNRTPDWHDAVADAVGGLVGALGSVGVSTFMKRHRPDTPRASEDQLSFGIQEPAKPDTRKGTTD
jgi:hypothetical protein